MFLLAVWLALESPSAATSAPSGSPVVLSGTAFFEQVALLDYQDQRACDHPARPVPSNALIRQHARAIPAACDPWWGSDESMWWTMLALLDSESGGHMTNTGTKEHTHGPYCTTIVECRESATEFRWITCPRSDGAIIERLETDPAWAALVTSCTLYRYTRMQRGDRMRGLMMYKMGGAGLARALKKHGYVLSDVPACASFTARMTRVMCLRDELCLGGPVIPCACGQW